MKHVISAFEHFDKSTDFVPSMLFLVADGRNPMIIHCGVSCEHGTVNASV